MALATLLLVALAPLVRGAAGDPPSDAERPSLVLVTIDTLRRERLGCYGYPRPTSPRVDALAAESVLFENALSPMATTFPSHLSMLTGLYPHQHGETSNRGAVRAPYAPAPGRDSAAGALAAVGYRTAGFVSAVVLDSRTGIGAGFQTYDGPSLGVGKRAARETMERALTWLAALPADQPFFLWVHLFDVHEPNSPEPELAALLAPDDELRALVARRAYDVDELGRRFGKKRSVGERFFGVPGPKAETQRPGLRTSGPPRRKPVDFAVDEAALVGLHARYDACVRQVDREVGRLIDALVARGSWARTAFVFTADHGQSLGEGARLGHGANVQINLEVPLVIHFPAGTVPQPAHSSRLVSLIDLMPTVLGALPIEGLDAFRAQFAGLDVLRPDFARTAVVTAETTEAHRAEIQPYEAALVTEHWKFARREGEAGRLYDLTGAGETVDVAAANETVARELAARLTAELASSVLAPEESAPVDPERRALLEQLEKLGYGGGDEDE